MLKVIETEDSHLIPLENLPAGVVGKIVSGGGKFDDALVIRDRIDGMIVLGMVEEHRAVNLAAIDGALVEIVEEGTCLKVAYSSVP